MQAKELRAWRTEFEHVNERIADCFVRREPRDRARAYLQGLLAPLERKNGWQVAESAGERSPDGVQDFLARSVWDADTVRDQLRDYVVEHLGEPETVGFRTKPQIGQAMLQRALKAGVPFAWVTADSVYGNSSRLRQTIAAASRSYVLAVQSKQVWGWPRQTVAAYADGLPARAWTRISCGAGAKGPRLYDWAYLKGKPTAGVVHGLLIRRHRRRHRERAYYLTYAPVDASLAKLVEVAGSCWTIESGFEQAKGAVGLDQYEVRRYDAWHRHLTLALLAHAYLVAVRARSAGKKTRPGTVARALAAHRAGSAPTPLGLGARAQRFARNDQGMVKVAASAPAARQAMSLGCPDKKAA